jgi:hypothetical protein
MDDCYLPSFAACPSIGDLPDPSKKDKTPFDSGLVDFVSKGMIENRLGFLPGCLRSIS